MPERTEQSRAKPPLDERVRDALHALDTAYKKLNTHSDAAGDAEDAAVEVQAALAQAAAEATPDEPGDPPVAHAPAADLEPTPQGLAESLGDDLDALLEAAGDVISEPEFDPDEPALAEDTPDASTERDEPARSLEPLDPPEAEPVESVESQLAEAVESGVREPVDPPASIEQLDDELADLAESIVEGDFEDAEGDVAADAVVPVTRVDDPPSDAEPEAIADAATSEQSQTDSSPPPDAVEDSAAPDAAEPKTPARTSPTKPRVSGGAIATLAARLVLLISKPTAGISTSTRDTIGWLGLYTGFLAICVWGFVMLFRKPIAPDPTAEAIGLASEVVASNQD